MRLARITAVGAAVGCVFAAAAAPALAKKEEVPKEFEATVGGKTKDVSLGSQQFRFGPYKITCSSATSTGEATAGMSTTLIDKVSFSECVSGKGKKATPATMKPWEVEFDSDGLFEIVNEPKITIEAASCTIDIESGEVGEEELHHKPVTYKTREPKKGEVAPKKL